ncbi:MAG: recombinase family protein [Helicobacteraceae bacterium]|nr:recombinase family protein [Helicobacteraceae bacterium]
MILGYIRISSDTQHLDRQTILLQEAGAEKVFSDIGSGKNMEREGLKNAIDFAREGDIFISPSFDRLSRSTKDLLEICDKLRTKGVTIKILNPSLEIKNKNDFIGNLILTILGAVAEMQRAEMLERQRQGIAVAKSKGLYKGRKPLNKELLEKIYYDYNYGVAPMKICRKYNISKSSFYKYRKNFDKITESKTKENYNEKK